jgi:hypothetical protein
MTAVADRGAVERPPASAPSSWIRREIDWLLPSLAAVLNAVAFVLVAPNVNDLFAGLAREDAVLHGVGLKYWFAWYGGGSTPGNYSVLTPALSAVVGASALAAIATAAITPLAWIALRGAMHPVAALWVATFSAALNLWSGRVPFALGSLLTVAVVIFVRRRQTAPAAVFALLTVAASPVSGVFLATVLFGLFLVRPQWRRTCALAIAPIGVSLLAVMLLFGSPGPETFSLVQLIQLTVTLAVFFIGAPPDWVRTSIWLALLAGPVLFFVPNGLGDNMLRLAWYCLPTVVVATSSHLLRYAGLGASAALLMSAKQTGGDLVYGSGQTASPGYYSSLITELDSLRKPLLDHRLEVVEDGTRTASFALLDHAMLARGYEYQEDNALNKPLASPDLDATAYKVWLQDNAVGYVAISSEHRKMSPEYRLVSRHRPGYLIRVWGDRDWTLFRVAAPDPIVRAPVRVLQFSQAKLVLRVPCACSFPVRLHKPGNLRASTTVPAGSAATPVPAELTDDGFGWTTMTTTRPGTYTLSGRTTGGILR